MHRTLFYTLFIIIFSGSLFADETKKDSIVYGWKDGLAVRLTLTQAGYTDWVQGGDNALSYTGQVVGNEILDMRKSNWSTAYNLMFGQARLGAQGLRKTDDQIKMESILTLKLDSTINPYASVTFNSQFSTGYDYATDGTATAVSDFLDPAYITQGIGAGYQPVGELKTRLGVAMREILTSKYNSYADDPSTPQIEKTSVKGGIQFGADLNWQFDTNLLYTSKLDLFDAFNALSQIIVHWDNMLAARVSKLISVNASLNVINEHDVSPRTQIKETIGITIGYSFF